MKILFAIDSSEASERARQFVEAHLQNQEVHTVKAETLVQSAELLAQSGAPAGVGLAGQAVVETYEVDEQGHVDREHPLSFSVDIADALVAAAEEIEADMIVVGTSEPGFLERLIVGSVSEDVVRKAECPVLVVK